MHDQRGRRIVAPDPLIGFKRQPGRIESVTVPVTFASATVIISSSAGSFDVTTLGGQRVTIPWCAFKPLLVTVTAIHATTAEGILAL